MHYLNLIRYRDAQTNEGRELRIVNCLAANWERFGETLGFQPPEINTIRHAGAGKTPEQCLRDVLTRWMQDSVHMPNHDMYPCTWKGLVCVLNDSQNGDIADNLSAAIEASSSDLYHNY